MSRSYKGRDKQRNVVEMVKKLSRSTQRKTEKLLKTLQHKKKRRKSKRM